MSNLCSLADVRTALGYGATETAKDAEISALLPVATTLLEAYARRNFTTPGAATKRLAARNGFLSLPDLQGGQTFSITRVLDSTLLVSETDYTLEPVDTPYGVYTYAQFVVLPVIGQGYAYTQSTPLPLAATARVLVDVAGTWGFPSVPTLANRAAVIAVAAWVSKGASVFNGANDGQGVPVSPAANWTLPYAAKDVIADLCIKSVG